MPHRAVIIAGALLAALFAALPMAAAQSGDAPMGAPRRWGAGMGVGPYGVVDLQTGRVLTTLPVVGWGGRGPSVSFSLYHNMTSPWSKPDGLLLAPKGDANADGLANAADIDPFVETLLDPEPDPAAAEACDMDSTAQLDDGDVTLFADKLERESCEPYWTHSYSSYLIVLQYTQVPTVILVGDDGTRDVFTGNAQGGYTAPPGIFATLTADAPPAQGFTLTAKSQWTAYYEPDPLNSDNRRLAYLQDPSSNRLTCAYINAPNTPAHGKLDCVTDASGRVLDLTYNQQGKLCRVTDPIAREWRLLYEDPQHPGAPSEEGTGYFVALEDPMEYRITWEYTDCGEIANIADKNGSAADPRYYHAFDYSDGRLDGVIDPAPFTGQTQHFAYAMDQSANQVTTYSDRRGEEWQYTFGETSGNLLETVDPLNHTQSFAYGDARPALVHEKTGYTNALGKTWTATYDAVGNVLTATDPLGHRTTMTYDALNNLLTVTPPADGQGHGNEAKQVEYIYHDANHLTSVTSILEPRAAENGPTPETQIVYWGPEDETPFGDGAWNGLVRSVTPPYDEERGSPVVTEYEYDAHGHLAYEQEGPPRGRTTPLPVENWITSDAAGQTTNCRNAAGCGDIVRDGNGNVLGITCCVMFAPPGGGQTSWLPFETCERPSVPPLYGEFEADPYTPNGEPTTLTNTIVDGSQYPTEVSVRQQLFSFDHLGRQTDRYSSTTEPGPSVPAMQRNFYYAENWTAGTADRWGPDGQHSYTQTDAAGRVTSFTRGAIEATQTYYDDDAVHTITYHNGTRTHYTYDDTGRPVIIRHETTQSDRLLELGYTWSADGLVDSIAELDDEDSPSKTIFTYDNRNRLTAEVRVGQHPYSLAYAYDLAGNRTAKVDVRNELQTEYVYDVSDPGQYGSQGNRLMASTLSGPGGVVEQRWYVYDLIGNVELVIRRITGDVDENENQWYRGTQLYYTKDGHLWMSRALRWQYDPECESENPPEGCEVVNCEYLAAMEYRYQGGRGRYMVRPRDPETMQLYPYTAADGQWFDYDGEGIYGDYSVSYDEQTQQWLATNTLAHEPGLAQYDHAWQALHHLHGNLIGTTERMTDGAGSIAHRAVYTAFGELIDESGAVGTRYGYAGAYGYQSASSQEPADPLAELGWLHVGERYYDPSAGRFVQRDPIGIRGGLNVYEYAKSGPVILVDPAGLTSSLYSPQGCAALIEAEIAVGGGNPVPVQFGTRMPVMVATTTIENATGELSLWPVGGGKAIIIAGDTTITAAQRAGGGVVIEGMTKPPTAGASSHHGWVVIVLGLLVAGPHLVRLAWFRRRLLRAYASSVAELLGGRGA